MAFLSWSARRQLFILGLVIIVMAIPVSYALFSYLHVPPSCFDGKRNQGEAGVDCSGPCTLECSSRVADLVILWSRAVKVLPGVYDAVALVENPNTSSGIREIRYSFTLFDRNNILIAERAGTAFINPNERFAIYEPAIKVGDKVPVKTFFEFEENPAWMRVLKEKPDFSVKNSRLEDLEERPRLRATLQNQSLVDARDIILTALLFDRDDNVIAASKTVVDFLEKGRSRNVTFAWPGKFEQEPEICLNPLDIMLVFDRSGSMNDDLADPPQPLTDAQNAARSFVDTLSGGDQIGLVSFATEASMPIDQRLTTNHDEAKAAIHAITIPPEEEVGFTNLGDGIGFAAREFASIRNNPRATKAMVVLTDGLANAPEDPGGEIYAKEKAKEAKEDDITIYAIGLGEKVNAEFLSSAIASGESRYYAAKERSELFDVYKEIAEVVCPVKTYPMTIIPRVNLLE